MIIQIAGTAAFSDIRREKLLDKLKGVEAQVTDISGQFIHFLETNRALSVDERNQLYDLLHDGSKTDSNIADFQECCTIVPRFGTVSPWSSKATEIVFRCGLSAVTRIERGTHYRLKMESGCMLSQQQRDRLLPLLFDRMTEVPLIEHQPSRIFQTDTPAQLEWIDLTDDPLGSLVKANSELGLALSQDELNYLAESFLALGRSPSDVELMMFAQANSEHCRHKIFNADWQLDGRRQAQSLFGMIRHTADMSPDKILSAYHDNAAVVEGSTAKSFYRHADSGVYGFREEPVHLLMKVETHNHPTAISPYPGAATGSGGEIRDEAATGRGSHTKAGLTGFSVSNLRIPGYVQPWESNNGRPDRIASALDIMLEAPIGGAAFNNEFGRPNLAGYFRTFEHVITDQPGYELLGYHKPIMIAGGMGNIRAQDIDKGRIAEGAAIVVLGGPAMLIGLGGGAASSIASGESDETLDFASVQRGNPEMQRRCQEVIDACCAMDHNPIISIHDVGAGGLSNAIPELLHDSNRGGRMELRSIPSADSGMSPLQIWCNEAQERYVLALATESLDIFASVCEREQCPYAVVGHAVDEEKLDLFDVENSNHPIDIPMSLLFGKPPKMLREVARSPKHLAPLDLSNVDVDDAVQRVLQFPAVADKSFLITIGDRSVTGLVVRDQLVGPWQVPVSDVAVTATGYCSKTGEAMAMGERTPLALISGPASARIAIGEALTNIAAASIDTLSDIKLSANWMAAAGHGQQDEALFDTVKAVGMELCPALGIAIPVGKDSLSMKTVWREGKRDVQMVSPLSLIVSAFCPVSDVLRTLTPQLQMEQGDTVLLLVDLGLGKNRLGGSALAQVYQQLGDICPDLDNVRQFKDFFECIQRMNRQGLLLAYHDRSDGGLFVTLCEMAFAARVGLKINIDTLGADPLAALFNEELGAVLQVNTNDIKRVMESFRSLDLADCVHEIGAPDPDQNISFEFRGKQVIASRRANLQRTWANTSFMMQSIRDDPMCAQQAFENIMDDKDPGLHLSFKFDSRTFDDQSQAPYVNCQRPKIAILREQGVNGHVEMAAAFYQAGFESVDVHMTDLISGRKSLRDYIGLVACGGFSYGDVLGAGQGWAKTILYNPKARDEFVEFFQRTDTFALGVCNGCQMFANLKNLIPGADFWPKFVRNKSDQFESRIVMVEILPSPSIFFDGMQGSKLPVTVAHGEGQVNFSRQFSSNDAIDRSMVALCYVDNYGNRTNRFPFNPNGSDLGITALTNEDGRFTIMMPHPERCFRSNQNFWNSPVSSGDGPWMRFFANARSWVC